MSTLPNAAPSDAGSQSVVSGERVIDYDLLARLVIREGKPFKQSALKVGYSHSVAACGLKRLMDESTPVAEAIRREWERINVGLEKLKPFAVRRLYSEIVDPGSSNAMRAIELAGRFKETDWFVRSSETNLGIFINLAETAPISDGISTFKE